MAWVPEEDERYQKHMEHGRKANAAFERLWKSKDGDLARRWNEWVASRDAEGLCIEDYDETFQALYRTARDAVTMPTKRKAMKAFFAFVDLQAL